MTNERDRGIWHGDDGLRIWRCADSDFYGDEPAESEAVYTDDVLRDIAASGFNAVWLRGRLRDLMRSTVFPALNREGAEARLDALARLIDRAKRHGVGVFLFFNEPLAVPVDDPFWLRHPEVAGEPHRDFGHDYDSLSLCTSHPLVKAFLREAIGDVLGRLSGLAGVLLITATEYHTHCWSHHALRGLDDGIMTPAEASLGCPRCREREPADVVSELAAMWCDAAAQQDSRPRVLCWNWSWSLWYDDPQLEVIRALPKDAELLLDFERGTTIWRNGRRQVIDEYSLSIVGPGERFTASQEAASQRGLPVHAKLQLGTTHEIATVPNLPLLERLHGKLAELTRRGAAGFMGTWNFGCGLTLNTAAVGLYRERPSAFEDRDTFLRELAARYFGLGDTDGALSAWRAFGEAFDHYPFSIRFVYWSPINYAPAYPLSPRYEARPLSGSWLDGVWGDRLQDSVPADTTCAEVADALSAVATRWEAALTDYEAALSGDADDPLLARHRREELSCARMIGVQVASAANIYHFHDWRLRAMERLGLTPPCDVPLDEEALAILRREAPLLETARRLTAADARLGVHLECHKRMYDPATIAAKSMAIADLLRGAVVAV